MRRGPLAVVSLLVFCLLAQAASGGAYSDITGVYARIDKVILEPSETSPQRIQIWGAFALARGEYGQDYTPVVRGYLYFSCPAGKEKVCRKEWADMRAISRQIVSATPQVIGFGSRRIPAPRVRKADQKPADPDQYPINVGLVRMSDRGADYPPIRELRLLPREPK